MKGSLILPELVHVPHLGVEEGEESEEEVGAYQIGEVEGDVPPWGKDFLFQQTRLSSVEQTF